MSAFRRLTLLAAASAMTLAPLSVALAQVPPATVGDRYVPAPWWMRDPVIASIGYVRTEIPANRAQFQASFQTISRTAAQAQSEAADKVRALSRALQAYGEDRVRVSTTLNIRPLYEQYRDEQGNIRENQRSDQVERYEANATVSIEVRDTAVLERVYASVLQGQPTSVSPVYFTLQPDNETKTRLQAAAVSDAARRAREAAQNAGATLGRVQVIDPTGRACQTDVLAGWPSYGASMTATDVDADSIVVTGSRAARPMAAPPPPPPPPPPGAPGRGGESSVEAAQLALTPPLQELTDQACVVYRLN
ncbi:SIMPL domain-containing protein [Brevundimonas sp. 2R-24]|uniref:SIMPL domain-containing protein n=1 Tax=Peiella sedimenti TaxID=3061083 RepID=A0ABT8SKM1_9CAUL|nr:SIMPL domain-containing protein [Caulobacteraceae bacterium XZ-24]